MSFSFAITRQPEWIIVHLKGKFLTDHDVQQLTDQIGLTSTHVVFDLTDLEHVNSSGINFLIRTLTKQRVLEKDVVVCCVKQNVLKLFEMAKLNAIFTVYDCLDDAKTHFNN